MHVIIVLDFALCVVSLKSSRQKLVRLILPKTINFLQMQERYFDFFIPSTILPLRVLHITWLFKIPPLCVCVFVCASCVPLFVFSFILCFGSRE
jgi:hypothetical protein